MTSLKEYDLKHLILMQKKIPQFEKGQLNLDELISDLQGLLHMPEIISQSWKDDFQSEVNTLEMIYDSIEDGSISSWEGNYIDDLHVAISKLKKLTNSILDEYLDSSDLSVLERADIIDSKWILCPKCIDAWESDSLKPMAICPKCESAFHNPRVKTNSKNEKTHERNPC